MAQPSENPYANFRVHILFGTDVVAGLTAVSGLTRKTPGIHLVPGQTTYDPLTLERGVTYDMAFARWANSTAAPTATSGSRLDFRKTITIHVHDEVGRKSRAYFVYECWVSEFNAMPELDGLGNALVIESMTLQHEGWSAIDETV